MHLVVSLAAHGWHPAAWRVTGKAGFDSVAPFRTMARTAERGGLDAVLLGLPIVSMAERARNIDSLYLDPRPLLGAMIAATRHIGLCADWPADIASRSHGSVVSTPEQIADHMQLWLDEGACDGFNIMPAFFPDEFDLFVDQVVPILQRRAIYRTEYEGTTLRDHLGLPMPRRT